MKAQSAVDSTSLTPREYKPVRHMNHRKYLGK
jgi:hypothetical protein